jgi:hypothetical protein
MPVLILNRAAGLAILCLIIFIPFGSVQADAVIADHTFCGRWQDIPDSIVSAIANDYEILYVHSSHGSQILTGLEEVYAVDNSYVEPFCFEIADDLGTEGDTSWVPETRNYLEHPGYDFNLAMFSWCGGVSWNTEQGINIYLAKMTELENDYPNVIFIYMTGHLDGNGPEGNLYARNNQIRNYCLTYNKVLFDFADIESYDPDGNYYPYDNDGCGWCADWCAGHDCPSCECAHSHCFNCFQKGKAWWVMAAHIEGWRPSSVDEDNYNLPNTIYLEQNYPNPFNSTTVIKYNLPEISHVNIDIYNIIGRRLETLVDEVQAGGHYQVIWNAADYAGGIYFYKIQAADHTNIKKMVLLK